MTNDEKKRKLNREGFEKAFTHERPSPSSSIPQSGSVVSRASRPPGPANNPPHSTNND